ncbi:uncharacterized protein LOC115922290 [Strongylocentrotus purpuratus]|uniref:Uncharacterized protein n=1 Tax=Strongylocentrotus purpuratus TaxID=7668 RepID=A0A7M7NM37_STRPU|nr:uncharacterized protein LOC115922290 [Strongylocentrotus purpuratus]
MDLLSLRDRRTRLLRSREYMLASNRLNKPPPWHSAGRRWAVSASTIAMAERERELVPNLRASCPPTFWSLQRSEPAKPGMRRAKTANASSYAERIRFKPEAYRAEPCEECDSMRECLNNEFLKNFDANQLKHVDTSTRNTLPTHKTISEERRAILGERGSHSARYDVKRHRSVHFSSAPTTSQGPRPSQDDVDVATTDAVQNVDGEET